MEKLAALCALWAHGLGTKEDYSAELDRLFLENPDDDFLLELENLGEDCAAAWESLLWIIETKIDVDKFGAELLSAFEKVYNENKFTLEELGKKCYNMWLGLPRSISGDYPFLSFCYAVDEPVFGETHTRIWYQKVFDYYKGVSMEKLAALCTLWAHGLGVEEDYLARLDRLFLENPDDDFLLELENLGGDCAAAWACISPLIQTGINIDKFGKELFHCLEKYYSENCNSRGSLEKFGKMCYKLWKSLPASIDRKDPFHTLSYADEPLSWGDEEQSRGLFQGMFEYYRE